MVEPRERGAKVEPRGQQAKVESLAQRPKEPGNPSTYAKPRTGKPEIERA